MYNNPTVPAVAAGSVPAFTGAYSAWWALGGLAIIAAGIGTKWLATKRQKVQ